MDNGFLRILFIAVASILLLTWLGGRNKARTISADTAKSYVYRLTGQQSRGVPLIVFASANCPYCNDLESQLKEKHVPYIRADVQRDENAVALQRQVGRATPTTIVGTKIVVGNATDEIIGDLAEERLNPAFR